jgi:hypothetical protein
MEVSMFRRSRVIIPRNTTHRNSRIVKRLAMRFSKRKLLHAARVMGPTLSRQNLRTFGRTIAPSLLAISLTSIAHAQGTVDFSGATTAMNSFKTFAEYAGAIICFGCLIFAGIRLMSGRFQDAIPGLFGALFGAGVLGWGAGWISSLTGQSVTQ